MNTTGQCIELYFKATSPSVYDISVVSVISISEEGNETTLVSNDGREPTMWNRLFAELSDGINKVAVEGRRSATGFSSLSVDDIVIQYCSVFGE